MHVPNPIEYLNSLGVDFTLVNHAPTFTAQHTAQAAHIKGNDLSKVIVVGDKHKYMMVVIPANCILLQRSVARLLKTPNLRIVPEYEFRDRFPECEVGAMPPFGNIYGMDVLVAKELSQKDTITFNGGSHSQLIRMKTNDFLNITGARAISVGYKVAGLSQPIISRRKDDWSWV